MRFDVSVADRDIPMVEVVEMWSLLIGREHTKALVAAKSHAECVAALGALRERVGEDYVDRILVSLRKRIKSERGLDIGEPEADGSILAKQFIFEPLTRGIQLARSTAHIEDALFSSSVVRDLPRRFELIHQDSGNWEHATDELVGHAHGWPTYSITSPAMLPYGPSFNSVTVKAIPRIEARSVMGMAQHQQVFSATTNEDAEPFYVGVTGGRMYGQNGKPLRGLVVGWIHLALIKRQARANSRWWFATFETEGRSVSMVTHPRHASILFASRDKVPPARRRAALAHWVRSHRRSLGHADVNVVAHLRGVREFSWNGFDVRLDPAGDDR